MVMHLVATGTNKFKTKEEGVTYLGSWCALYDDISDHDNNLIIPYHWDDREKLYKDSIYLDQIYELVLSLLSSKLNEIHETNHGLRYWRIILGPWLITFVNVLFDRWEIVNSLINANQIFNVEFQKRSNQELIPLDYSSFESGILSDAWNDAIFSRLVQDSYSKKIHITWVEQGENIFKDNNHRFNFRISSRVISKFIGWNRPRVFYNLWVRGSIFRRFIGLMQQRFQLREDAIPSNMNLRQWHLECKFLQDDFLKYVLRNIAGHLPISYLEGYKDKLLHLHSLELLNPVSEIYTSVSHYGDEYFKIWAANQTEKKAKLAILQHGGTFRVMKINAFEKHELKIADAVMTYGSVMISSEIERPVGFVKHDKKNIPYKKNTGNVLIVLQELPRYFYQMYSVPIAGQYLRYIEDQKQFIGLLSSEIQKKIIIRPYPVQYGWNPVQRIKKEFPWIKNNLSKKRLYSDIADSRIIVSTYNSTGYLESLYWNIPTLIYWDPDLWELSEASLPFFNELLAVKILHKSPIDASEHLESIWDNIEKWWALPAVQRARKNFCFHFASFDVTTRKNFKTLMKKGFINE